MYIFIKFTQPKQFFPLRIISMVLFPAILNSCLPKFGHYFILYELNSACPEHMLLFYCVFVYLFIHSIAF